MPLFDPMENADYLVKIHPVGDYQSNATFIIHKESKKTLIVDPGFDADFILEEIKNHSLKVTKIIHTHAHFDHAGQSSPIHKSTKAPMYMHKDDEELYNSLFHQGGLFDREIPKPLPLAGFFGDGDLIKIDDDLDFTLRVFHTPGHTQGSCSFYTEDIGSPLLIAGDTLFRLSIGRTDLPGGDFNKIMDSIKNKLFTLPDETFVVTGHGPGTTIAFEKKSNPFVQ